MNNPPPHTLPQVFWGEISPCDHFVQIYDDASVMLDLLEGFAAGGLRDGDGVVIIATQPHMNALDARLLAQGIDLKAMRDNDRYLTRDASDTLAKFMVNDWPDENLFRETITEMLTRARGEGRHVRAFGEMVAILWANGQSAATVRLEHLWHQFNAEEQFSLFCAYPRVGFTQDAEASIAEICAAHSKVVQGTQKS